MTGVIAGVGLGLERSSASILGSAGLLGSASVGQAGDDVYVNAATGNLVVQATDQILIGLGGDDVTARTYNSLGQLSDSNGALWSDAASRQVLVSSLTGTVNTVGSTIERVAADGSVVTYTYDASRGSYVGNEGGGAYDSLTYNAATNLWTWTDGASQTTEIYDNAQDGRIVSSTDAAGQHTQVFTYTASGLLSSVATANGETTSYTYDAADEISSIQTALQGGATSTQVYYAYDSLGRLTATTIDLTPGDNSTSDGNVYVTQYGYNGDTNQLSSVTQSDGSQLQITYNASGQVASLLQTTAGGESTGTTFDYGSGSTTVTNGQDDSATLDYDAAGRLTSLVTPAGQSSSFTYDAMGNVLTQTQPDGATTTYTYDSNGNRTSSVDSLGDTVVSTYSASNKLLSTTQFVGPSVAGAPATQALTTSYVYSDDGSNDLLYQVAPDGAVTQYLYQGAPGEVTSTLRYPASSSSPPLAGNLTAQVTGSGATTIPLSLQGGAATSLTITTQPSHGTVEVEGGTLTYTPAAGYSGPDSFVYTATNACGTSAPATVTLSPSSSSGPSYSLAQLQAWTGASWDKSGVERVDTAYDARGAVQSVTTYATTNSNGSGGAVASQVSYVYAPGGELLSQQSAGFAASVLNTYDGLGRVTSTTNADGVTSSFSYTNTASGSAITATNLALGQVTTSVYDDAGQLTQSSDSTYPGAATTYAYDSLGELRMVTDPTGVSTYSISDADGRKVADITADGSITTYAYNADGQVVETTQYAQALSAGQLALLDVSGTPAPVTLSQVLPPASAGDQTTYSLYDAVGRLAETIDGSGAATVYSYDGASQLTSKTLYANLISPSELAGFESAPPTSVVTPTPEPGSDEVTTYSYDADGRLTQTVVNAGGLDLTSTRTYDAFGNLVASTDPAGATTRFVYNTANQLVYQISPDGFVTQTSYNAEGALASTRVYATALAPAVLAALSSTPSATTLAADLTSSSRDEVTTYAYDAEGRLVQSVVDPGGANVTTTDTYDSAGDLIAVEDGDGDISRYAYNSDGQRIYTIDASGDVVQTSYAANGQLASSDAFATPLTASDLSALSPGAMSALTPAQLASSIASDVSASASDRVVHDIYDADGQLAFTIDGLGQVTGYVYDSSGRAVQTTVFGAAIFPTSYSYAAIEGLVAGQVGSDQNEVTRTVYNAVGEVAYSLDAEGHVTAFTYDAAGHVVQENSYASVFIASGAPSLATLQSWAEANAGAGDRISRTVYDAAGRAIYEIDPAGDVVANSYDGDGRVVQTTAYATPLSATQLATLPAVATGAEIAALITTASADRITRAAYNGEGELAYTINPDGDVTGYSYDAEGHLVSTQAYATPLSATTLASLALTVSAIAAAISTSGSDETSQDYYDAAGQLAYTVDAVGYATEYDYDTAGRLVQTVQYAMPIASGAATYAAVRNAVAGQAGQAANRVTRTIYNASGEVAFSINADGDVTAYTYDAFGKVVRQDQLATILTGGGVPSLAAMQNWAAYYASSADRVSLYVYDADGQEVYAVDADGDVVGETYNAAGELVATRAYATPLTAAQIASLPATPSPDDVAALLVSQSTDEITRYIYDADGRLTYEINALGDVTQSVYDSDGELVSTTAYATPLSEGVLASLPLAVSAETLQADLSTSSADQTTRYIYDAGGRLSYKIDAAGYVTGTTYDAFGEVLSTDAYATALSAGQLAALSVTTTAAEVAAVLVTTDEDAASGYTYDNAGRLLSTTDATGAVTATQYDAFGNAVKVTDPRGQAGYFYYDALNRQVMQVDPDGYAMVTAYSLGDQVIEVDRYQATSSGLGSVSVMPLVNAGGGVEVTKIGRDDLDRIISNTDAGGYVESYGLDAFGDRLTITNQLGGVTTNTYDGRGLLTSEVLPIAAQQAGGTVANASVTTEASSVVNAYRYDSFGNRTTQIEAAGLSEQRTTHYAYDALNRRVLQEGDAVSATSVNPSAGTITASTLTPTVQTSYDAFGNVLSTVDADGNRNFYYYDVLNRKVGQVDPAGVLSTWTYDAFDNVQAARVYGDPITAPASAGGAAPAPVDASNYRETDYSYDQDNRLTQTSIAGVLVGQYTDGAYQAQTTTVTTKTVYDASGDIIQTIDGDGDSTYFYYDAAGRKIAQVDGDNYLTTYQLDDEGNVLTEDQYATAVSIPVTASTSLATLMADTTAGAEDRITTFTYDDDGQRLSETRENVQASTVNALGQVSTTEANSTVSYTYNGLGEVASETQATGDATHNTYDTDGRLTAVSTAPYISYTGATVQPTTLYFYDGLNDLTMTAVGNAGAPLSADHVTQNTYGPGGRLATSTDASGFEQSFAYDGDGDLTEKSYQRLQSDGSSVLEADTYDYDAMGRQVSSSVADMVGGAWAFGDVQQQSYDAFGEVVSKGVNGGAQESFSYDKAGRLVSSNADSGAVSFVVDDADGDQTLEIDSAGASLSGDTVAQALATVVGTDGTPIQGDGVTATFSVYDGRGAAVQTVEPFRQLNQSASTGTATLTDAKVYDAFGDVVQDTDAAGAVTTYTFNAMGDLSEQQDPQVASTSASGVTSEIIPTLNYFYDISGRQVASEDANGNITSTTLLAGTGYDGATSTVLNQYDPDGGETLNTYDVWGNKITVSDAMGDSTDYAYDAMNRVVSETSGIAAAVHLYGTSGADVLRGGSYEQGNGGADTFIYDKGYGAAEISEDNGWSANSDAVLQLGGGLSASSVTVTSDSSGDILISDGVAADQIKLDAEMNYGYYGAAEYGVASVQFSDGSSLSRQQLINLATTGSQANNGHLYGSTAAESFDSQGYSHFEQGGGGADTFVYAQGYGQLEINEDDGWSASNAVLQLGAGLTASSITVTGDSSGDVIISDRVSGDQLKLDRELYLGGGSGLPEYGVSEVRFSDGTSLSRQQLNALATTGSLGNDGPLYGSSEADTFDSHGYAQYEQGNGGADTFVYDQGYGQLEVNDNNGWSNSAAVLQLGAGVTAASITVSSDSTGDILISDGVAGDLIKIDSQASNTADGVALVQFSDGSSLTRSQLATLATTGSATNSGSLYGSGSADTFDSQGYAHFEQGDGGGDTFVYNQGYGQLEIDNNTGWNTNASVLQLGSGITASSLTAVNDGSGDLLLTDGVAGDQIKLDDVIYGGQYGVSEVKFADGSTLSTQQLISLADAAPAPTYLSGTSGTDTFVYASGGGQLEINEDAGWGDTSAAVLQLGAGITAASLTVSNDGAGDLTLIDGVGGDQIKLDREADYGWNSLAEYGVSEIQFSDGTSLSRQQIIDLSETGSQGNDGRLYGGSTADTLDSHGYSHYEQGNGGTDTFVYDQGYGALEINEDGGWQTNSTAVLQFGADITAASLSVTGDAAGDLIVSDGVAGDQIKIDGGLKANGSAAEYGVGEIRFADGSSLSAQQLMAMASTGSSANDGPLYGSGFADTMDSHGIAHLEQGDGGADTFIYDQGYGQLEINENGGWVQASTADLQLGAGMTQASITISGDSNGDLIITDGVSGDQIKLDGELNTVIGTPDYGVAEVTFADGTSLSRQQLIDLAATGSTGNNAGLYGTAAAETLDSQGKSQYEQGSGGVDTFIYDQGYGQLEISDNGGWTNPSVAVLQLGTGLSAGSLSFSGDANGDLIITDGTAGDRIQVDNELNIIGGAPEDGVAEITFADGYSLSRQQIVNIMTPANGLTTYYSYNGLGERLSESNSEFGAGVEATTDYDSQGRITRQVDYDGNVTGYTYSYDGSLATDGMGTFGGWVETETNSSGLTSTTDQDFFGRTVGATDFGGDVYADTFDAAGRLVTQTMTDPGGALATTTTNSYYNTGALAAVETDFGWATNGVISTQSTYSYDGEGNRLTETYTSTTNGADPSTISYEDATATYDAMNRMVSYTDTGHDGEYPISINYQYDANSNIRHMVTTSVSLVADAGTTTTQDYWYAYDAMNRFTITEGTLFDGAVVRGATGSDITYNLAGERASETSTSEETVDQGGNYVTYTNENHIETFTYTPGGYLASTSISEGSVDPTTHAIVQNGAFLAAVDVRDALGRVVNYIEYTNDGDVYYSSESTYDNDGELTSQTENTAESDGSTLVATTTYDYDLASGGGYTGAYQGGEVTHSHESAYSIDNGSEVNPTTNDTVNTYAWSTAPYETGISYTTTANQGVVQTTGFTYDAADNLVSVDIQDGTPSTIAYTTDAQGQIMSRLETSSASSNPETFYYFFNGQQVGEITNDGSEQVQDYAQAIAVRSAKAAEGPFANGVSNATAYAAFGDAYQPITPTSQGSFTQTNSTYSVKSGDTLASIASALWGDSSLWYLIADANGLSGSASLSAGQVLNIPSQVTNVHNNAATFSVYDPTQAIGDVQPLNPPPAQNNGGCGIFGEILAIVVAVLVVVVAAVVAPELEPEIAAGLETVGVPAEAAAVAAPIVTGATLAAAGSAIDQGVDIGLGLQKSFSFSQVGIAALSGGLSAGLAESGSLLAGNDLPDVIARTAVSGLTVQGVEVASGMEKSFNWAAVATGVVEQGVIAGASGFIDQAIGAPTTTNGQPSSTPTALSYLGAGLTGIAAALAGAATQTALTGANFGKSLEDALPGTLGQTLGQTVEDGELSARQPSPGSPASASQALDNIIPKIPGLNLTADQVSSAEQEVESLSSQAQALAQSDDPADQVLASNLQNQALHVLDQYATDPASQAYLSQVYHYLGTTLNQGASAAAFSDSANDDNSGVAPVTVKATPYGSALGLLDRPLDSAGVFASQVQGGLQNFIAANPAAGTALQFLSLGVLIAGGPTALAGALVTNAVQGQISQGVTNTFNEARFPSGIANSAGQGASFLSSVAVIGLGIGAAGSGLVAGAESSVAAESEAANGSTVLFGQVRASPSFSTGKGVPSYLSGRPIADVSADLQTGVLRPDQLPVEVFRYNGQLVSANTRTLAALSDAGLTPTNVTVIEPTQSLLDRLDEAPLIDGGQLPGPTVPITPSRSDPTITKLITVPGY